MSLKRTLIRFVVVIAAIPLIFIVWLWLSTLSPSTVRKILEEKPRSVNEIVDRLWWRTIDHDGLQGFQHSVAIKGAESIAAWFQFTRRMDGFRESEIIWYG